MVAFRELRVHEIRRFRATATDVFGAGVDRILLATPMRRIHSRRTAEYTGVTRVAASPPAQSIQGIHEIFSCFVAAPDAAGLLDAAHGEVLARSGLPGDDHRANRAAGAGPSRDKTHDQGARLRAV